jgi:RHS repeat-associated protein
MRLMHWLYARPTSRAYGIAATVCVGVLGAFMSPTSRGGGAHSEPSRLLGQPGRGRAAVATVAQVAAWAVKSSPGSPAVSRRVARAGVRSRTLALFVGPCANGNITVNPCPGSISLTEGLANQTTDFRVQNGGSTPQVIDLSCAVTSPVKTCSVVSSINAPAHSLTHVTVTYSVSNAIGTLGTVGVGSLTMFALSENDESNHGQGYDTVKTQELPTHAVTVVAGASVVNALANASGTVSYTITNTGSAQDSFAVAAACHGTGVASCGSATPSSVHLAPNGATTVSVAYTAGAMAGNVGTIQVMASRTIPPTASDSGWTDVTVQTKAAHGVSVINYNPGALREPSQCLDVAIRRGAAVTCGDFRYVHALPAVRTFNKPRVPVLVYQSQTAHPYVLATAVITADTSHGSIDSVVALLRVNGVTLDHARLPGASFAHGVAQRVVLAIDDSAAASGVVTYVVRATTYAGTSTTPDSATGSAVIQNARASHFGRGWLLAGLENLQLAASPPSAPLFWTTGAGEVRSFQPVTGKPNYYSTDSLDHRDTIIYSPATQEYTRIAQHRVQVVFDALGRHIQTIDRQGHITTFAYRTSPANSIDLALITVPGGLTYRFDTATTGYISQVVASGVGATRIDGLFRDSVNQLVKITDPDNTGDSLAYSTVKGGLVSAIRDRRHTWTTIAYDTALKVRQAVVDTAGAAPLRLTTQFTVQQSAGFHLALSPDSAFSVVNGPRVGVTITKFWLDRFGAPLRIRNALGYETLLAKSNPHFPSLVTRAKFANQRVVVATYDRRGNDSTQTDSSVVQAGTYATTRYVFDTAYDFVTKVTHPMGEVVLDSLDAATGNRLWQQVGTDVSRRVRFGYYPATAACPNLVAFVQTPLATGADSVVYDHTLCDVDSTRTPLKAWTRSTVDAIGRVFRTASPASPGDSVVDSLAFDVLDRDTLSVTFGLSASHDVRADTLIVRDSFDIGGNLTSAHRMSRPDRNGIGWVTTFMHYDAAGRQASEAPPNKNQDSALAERYALDAAGNDTAHTTRRGYAIRTAYDALNRAVQRITPATLPDSVKTIFDSSPSCAPSPCEWDFPRYPNFPTFSSPGQLVIPGDTATFAYDAVGGLLTAFNATARITRTYYADGALKTDQSAPTTWIRGDVPQQSQPDHTVHVYRDSLGYDLDRRRVLLRVPANVAPVRYQTTTPLTDITYGYDAVTAALDTVTDVMGNRILYFYDAEQRLDSVAYPGSVGEARQYDGEARLLRRIELGSSAFVGNSSGVPGQLHHDSLTYDLRNRITANRINFPHDSIINLYGLPDGLDSTVAGGNQGDLQDGPSRLGGRWITDALGFRFSASICQLHIPCTIPKPIRGYVAYEVHTGRLLQDSITNRGAAPGVYDYAEGFNFFGLRSSYDSSGNARYHVSVPEDNLGRATGTAHAWKAYGADERLRVVDERRCVLQSDGHTCASPTGVAVTQAGPYEEYLYDALGRRVIVRTRLDPVLAPLTTGTGCADLTYCRGTIERDVWDGDQTLVEIRMPDGDNSLVTLRESDTATVYSQHVNFGRVLYVHGLELDRPLSIIRTGYAYSLDTKPIDPAFAPLTGATAVFPHVSWRDLMDDGNYADGTEVNDTFNQTGHCFHYNGNPANNVFCTYVTWPDSGGGMFMNEAATVPPDGPLTWFGSLARNRTGADGQQYARNRYYDAQNGRFTQEDPIGLAGGLNAYGFAGGDPVNYDDPFGLCGEETAREAQANTTQSNINCAQRLARDANGLTAEMREENAEGNIINVTPSPVSLALMVTVPEARAAGEAFTMLEGPAQGIGQRVLQEFFGQSVRGAEARLASRTITPGVTRELLEDYATRVARPIVSGTAPAAQRTAAAVATQSARLRLIDQALTNWPSP